MADVQPSQPLGSSRFTMIAVSATTRNVAAAEYETEKTGQAIETRVPTTARVSSAIDAWSSGLR